MHGGFPKKRAFFFAKSIDCFCASSSASEFEKFWVRILDDMMEKAHCIQTKDGMVDFDLENDLNLIRSAGGYGSETFTRSTVCNYIDRYGVVKEIAIDNSGAEKNGTKFEGSGKNLLTTPKTPAV